MRLALVCKSFKLSRGGHEKYLNRLVQALVERGHFIHILSQEFEDAFSHNQVNQHRVRALKLGRSIRRLSFNYLARRAAGNLRKEVDLVLTTGKVNFGDVYRAGGGVHRRYLERCAGPFERLKPKHWVACELQKTLFTKNTPRKIIVNSKMVKGEIIDEYGVDPGSVKVIYNGINTERFHFPSLRENRTCWRHAEGYDDTDRVALFVAGGAWKRKGLPTVLKGMGKIPSSNVKLLVVGRTSTAKVNRVVGKYGIEDRVKMVEYTERIEKYYTLSDFLVFPSRYDAGSSVVIEALASGLPVITSKTNGTHELITPSQNGWVVDNPDDVQELTRTMNQALQNRDRWPGMRKKAFETGRNFSMNRHVERIEDVLTNLSN